MRKTRCGGMVLLALAAAGCLPGPPVLVQYVDASLAGQAGEDAGVRVDSGPPQDGGRITDGGPARDGGAGRDAGVGRDAAACEPEDVWVRVPADVVGVELFTTDARIQGITERLAVTVRLPDICAQLPAATASIQQGGATDFVEVTATVFVNTAGCVPAFRSEVMLVSIPGSQQGNPRVVVRWEGGQFAYERQLCSGRGCQCGPNQPRGTAQDGTMCLSDCDCDPQLLCLAVPGAAGGVCAIPCRDGVDCLPRGTRCLPFESGRPPNSCALDRFCLGDSDCPVEFACVSSGASRQCEDRRAPTGGACACQGDCGIRQTCAPASRPFPTCERLCNQAGECPPNNACLDGVCWQL